MLKVKYLKQRKIFEISLTKSRIYKKLQTSGIIREPERGGGGSGIQSGVQVEGFIKKKMKAAVDNRPPGQRRF